MNKRLKQIMQYLKTKKKEINQKMMSKIQPTICFLENKRVSPTSMRKNQMKLSFSKKQKIEIKMKMMRMAQKKESLEKIGQKEAKK